MPSGEKRGVRREPGRLVARYLFEPTHLECMLRLYALQLPPMLQLLLGDIVLQFLHLGTHRLCGDLMVLLLLYDAKYSSAVGHPPGTTFTPHLLELPSNMLGLSF